MVVCNSKSRQNELQQVPWQTHVELRHACPAHLGLIKGNTLPALRWLLLISCDLHSRGMRMVVVYVALGGLCSWVSLSRVIDLHRVQLLLSRDCELECAQRRAAPSLLVPYWSPSVTTRASI